jgi:flagellar biosynthesis protein FlhF
MKIKRFEADNMSEALRRIKKEFGDEAVILSAKSQVRNKRFLGKKSASQVVVTAAIDKQTNGTTTGTSPLGAEKKGTPQAAEEATPNDTGMFAGSSFLKRFNPITKTGQKILKPKIVEKMKTPIPETARSPMYQRLLDRGLCDTIAAEWDRQIQGLLPDDAMAHPRDAVQALSQAIQAKQLVGTHHRHQPMQQRIIILMGPSGAGKTSAAAKMATKLALQHPDAVAILSLDNQRVAGAAELERFAPIIGVPFQKTFKSEEIESALADCEDYSHIIVDTPAVCLDDPLQREKLRRLLPLFDDAEHLLVINASIQEKTMARMTQYFKPLTIHSYCFTGLDWCVEPGVLINQSNARSVPIGFISDSSSMGEELKPATADLLAELLIGEGADAVSVGPDPVTVVTRSKKRPDHYYVANRNSDIFHFHECKSVKRIHADNMVVFRDSAEAMGQQFKPCRMCCSEFITAQPSNRLARGYAGNRY